MERMPTSMMLWSLLIIFLIEKPDCPTCSSILTKNMTTSQSTVYDELRSENAIDGNLSLCAHTVEGQPAWWQIDMLGVYKISSFTISNIEHHNSDIDGAQIHIGNSREINGTTNSMCTNITKNNTYKWHFECERKMLGRYITVSSAHHLVLCEVDICGIKQESPFELIAENKTWDDALNYCRDRDMDLASILDEDAQVWAELEAKKANSPFVWLALHYTCTLEFWFWVDDHRLDFTHWAPENVTADCYMSGAMETTGEHFWFSMSDSREFNFICAKC